MSRISRSWIVIAFLAGLWGYILAQQSPAKVPNRHVNARKGQSANFTCESQGSPISVCLWERLPEPGSARENILINFVAQTTRPGTESSIRGYFYMGNGLDRGQCGLNIKAVRDNDNGAWQCTLITTSGTTLRGDVHLGILQKPQPPKLEPSTLPSFKEDDSKQTKITCFSANGVPQPKFQWFIGNDTVTSGLGPVNETISTQSNREVTYTFQEFYHKFTAKDNGKKLRCVLIHDALTEQDQNEVTADITVTFRPRSIRPDGRDQGSRINVEVELGEDTLVKMNISSNPKPSKITWVVDGKNLEQGVSNERYEAIRSKQVGPGVYEAILKIKSVEEEDLSKKFGLKVQNPFGRAEYEISLATTSSGSEGLSAGGILGIVLAILATIILVAVGLVYTRARGLLCFKGDDGTASEKERMDGGSTGGTGVGDEKPATKVGLSSRLSAFYENLVKKKEKNIPGPVDEEAPKEKDAEKTGTDGEKKPDDIVYAELDLARSGQEGQRPEMLVRSDDKTEYAEIVGVVTKNGEDASPKKSPQGSPQN